MLRGSASVEAALLPTVSVMCVLLEIEPRGTHMIVKHLPLKLQPQHK